MQGKVYMSTVWKRIGGSMGRMGRREPMNVFKEALIKWLKTPRISKASFIL